MVPMETLRAITRNPVPPWARAIWPPVALAAASMLDQSTRRPSVVSLLLSSTSSFY